MYSLVKVKDKVRVPPKQFTSKLENSVLGMVQQEYEGLVDEDIGLVVAVTSVGNVGEGIVVPGDGSAYYDTEIEMLVYKPLMHEVVEGNITEITEFGAFVRISPIEGLIHVSQIMDDFINYDAKTPAFVGKKTRKKLIVDDSVLARIVTISLKGNIQNSKIGLTMRQPFLGKDDWIKVDEKTIGTSIVKERKVKSEKRQKSDREEKKEQAQKGG